MNRRRKVLVVLATIILVWIATPIPEATILLAIITGVTGYSIFPNWQIAVLCSVAGSIAGLILSWRLKIFGKLKTWAKEQKNKPD